MKNNFKIKVLCFKHDILTHVIRFIRKVDKVLVDKHLEQAKEILSIDSERR